MDADLYLLAVSLDFDLGDTEVVELLFERLTQLVVLGESSAEILLACVPTGIPIFDYAHTQSVRINFLTHNLNLPLVFFFLEYKGDVRSSLVDAERSALCSGTNSFKDGACCRVALGNVEPGYIHVMVVLSISHS